jgi:hypothetical protein
MFGWRKVAINSEAKYTLKVGHDRNGRLIIKELRVSGDNLEDVIAQVKLGIEQFEQMQVEKVLGV